MTELTQFDQRPIVVAVAGPNGAGKTTFYHSHLEPAGLRFINADVLSRELASDPYAGARLADALRRRLVKRNESFVLETVFSDPAGGKLAFLRQTQRAGYTVVLCYFGLSRAEISAERVAMRVSQGGHDVPARKLKSRYPRTLANLKAAIGVLPHILIFDNTDLVYLRQTDLDRPFRKVAVLYEGRWVYRSRPLPEWLKPFMG